MIGIVILNYNTYEETIALVEALQRQTAAERLRIIVVDNASPNGSFVQLKPLEERYTNVSVIQAEQNTGYAKGNNLGLKYLEENIGPTYLAVLNNDVELTDDCFERLAERYPLLDNPCIIAPTQLNTEGQAVVIGNLSTFTGDLLNLSMLYRRFGRKQWKVTDTTGLHAMKVEIIPGSFMFASLDSFRSIGYFYPNTFLYAEERFVGFEAKHIGYNNYTLTDLSYIHRHGTTIKQHHNSYSTYKMYYDSLLEYTRVCRNSGRTKAAILKPLTYISLLEIKLANLLRRR